MMQLFEKLKNLAVHPDRRPELLQAQVKALAVQVPVLYFILITNTVFVAVTHLYYAPFWLVLLLPVIFCSLATWRMFHWWGLRNQEIDPQVAAKKLRATIFLTVLFAACLTTWSLALYPYGGPFEKSHIAFFMGLTMVACVLCLMHLRVAANAVAVIVGIPFVLHFAGLNNPVFVAISINLLLAAAAMLHVVSRHSDEFEALVVHKLVLEKTNHETKRLSDENFLLANRDTLTKMPNRRRFFADIGQQIETSEKDHTPFAVGLIDMDGFKAVNDLYGHAKGDALLIEVATRLRTLANDEIYFARLGGDEFGVISKLPDRVSQLGAEICHLLRQPYVLDDVTLEVTVSCGFSRFPENCTTKSELLEYADYALYQAKSQGSDHTVVFSSDHRNKLRFNHKVTQTMRVANLESETSVVYQPIMEWHTGRVHSIEALARWHSPVLGTVMPSQFIAAAERSPLINKLTLVLLKQVLEDMALFPAHIKVSFNLSVRNLSSPETIIRIVSLILSSGVDPKRLEFEVTETALMIDFDAALKSLKMLRSLGASIALDDFGTGYSSLSYVNDLPLDKIKIDSSFVKDASKGQKAQNIVKTIVGLTQDLNLSCVAEGVETTEQAQFLASTGCRLMQGYLFSKPIGVGDMVGLIQAEKPASLRIVG